MQYLLLGLLLLNAAAFLLMRIDKEKARRRRWRIPEATLFTLAALGGSPGILAGMYVFHHKTRHRSFTWGVPAILVLQIALVFYLLFFI